MIGLLLALLQVVPPPAPTPGSGPFEALSPLSLADTVGGADFFLEDVEGDPTVPGREVIAILPGAWAISVGRWHPAKHGVGGALAGPGLCLEGWTPIAQHGPVWHVYSVGDFTSDGYADVIVYTLGPSDVWVYRGRGLKACR